MDISGLPGVLLKITIADIDHYVIPLMINFIFIGIIAIAVLKLFHITYNFGFSSNGLAIIISSVVFGLGQYEIRDDIIDHTGWHIYSISCLQRAAYSLKGHAAYENEL